MQGIYEIVNLWDGKASAYIGSSSDIEQRWHDHHCELRNRRHGNVHLQAAWDKYGEVAFVFSVLEEVGDEMLLIMEQEYLDDYFDRGHCYNLRAIAGPAGPMSEEHKRKISAAKMGKCHTEESRRNMSKAQMGHEVTEATRRNISIAHIGKKQGPPSEEHRRKISEALTGRRHGPPSEEIRRKISATLAGRKNGPPSEETRRKISEANKGKPSPMLGQQHSEETRRKMSESNSKPYPAFMHCETGVVICGGHNLKAMCERRGFSFSAMCGVKNGKRGHHKGWKLKESEA